MAVRLRCLEFGRGMGAALSLACSSAAFPQATSAVRLPPTAFSEGDSAFELLAQSLRRECTFNVSALIDQRDPFAAGWQRVKIERDKRGRVHKCVLQPLRMQGIESVDDGQRWLTVLPDQKMVLDQTSPSKDECDEALRLKLARSNYRFEVDGHSTVAGRQVVTIVARPVHAVLYTRRYSLDSQTLYPLKVEEVRNGSPSVEFVTLDVSYPASVNPEEFVFRQKIGMRTLKFDRPANVRSSADAERILGFTPLLPKGRPLGFEAQEMQVNQDGKWQALVIRLTDGLIRATVYEYADDHRPVSVMEQCSVRESDGIRLLVVCPLSESIRQTLLDSFTAARRSRDLSFSQPGSGSHGTPDPALRVGKYRAQFQETHHPAFGP